jgi:hypothetical protein
MENSLYLEDAVINEIRAKYDLELFERNLEPELESFFEADHNDDFSEVEVPEVNIKEVLIKAEPIFGMEYKIETTMQEQSHTNVKSESDVKKAKKNKTRRKEPKKSTQKKVSQGLDAFDDKDYTDYEKQARLKKTTKQKKSRIIEKAVRQNVIKEEHKAIL